MEEEEDGIKSALNVIGCEDMEWIQVAQGQVYWWGCVNMEVNILGSMKGNEFLD